MLLKICMTFFLLWKIFFSGAQNHLMMVNDDRIYIFEWTVPLSDYNWLCVEGRRSLMSQQTLRKAVRCVELRVKPRSSVYSEPPITTSSSHHTGIPRPPKKPSRPPVCPLSARWPPGPPFPSWQVRNRPQGVIYQSHECLRKAIKRSLALSAPSMQYSSSLACLTPELAELLLTHMARERLLRPRTLELFFGCPLQKFVLNCYPYTTNELLRQLRAFSCLKHLSFVNSPLITGVRY